MADAVDAIVVLPNGVIPLGGGVAANVPHPPQGPQAPPAAGAFAAPPALAPAPAPAPGAVQQPIGQPVAHAPNPQDAAALGQVVAMAFQQGVAAAAQQVAAPAVPPPPAAPAQGVDPVAGVAHILQQHGQTLAAIQTSINRRDTATSHRSSGTHAGTAAAAALFVRGAVASNGEQYGIAVARWVADLDDDVESGVELEKAVKAFERKVAKELPDCEREGRRLALCILLDGKAKKSGARSEREKDRLGMRCRSCLGLGHFARDCPSRFAARLPYAPQPAAPLPVQPQYSAAAAGGYACAAPVPAPYISNPVSYYAKFCEHCHRYGHVKESCYLLHGKPGGTA